MNTQNTLIGPDPTKIHGCKFCRAKSMKLDGNGREWWHPATDCCAPAATLQLVWRTNDTRAAGDAHDQATDLRIRRELGALLDDAQADERAARDAFHAHVRTEDDLRVAIRECRDHGYETSYAHAVTALRRRAA